MCKKLIIHKTVTYNKEKIFKNLAGAPGFEPGIPIPKTGALPLGHAPLVLINGIFNFRFKFRQELIV